MGSPVAVPWTHVRMVWVAPNSKEGSCHIDVVADTEPDISDLVAMANAMATTADDAYSGNSWVSNLSSGYILRLATAQNFNYDGTTTTVVNKNPPNSLLHGVEPVSIQVVSTLGTVPGTLATGDEVPSAALAIRLRSATPGRRFEGRLYPPAFSEESSDNAGTITTGEQAFVEAWLTAAIAGVIAAGPGGLGTHVVVSRTTTFGSLDEPSIEPVVDFSVDRRIRTQRRRQVRTAIR